MHLVLLLERLPTPSVVYGECASSPRCHFPWAPALLPSCTFAHPPPITKTPVFVTIGAQPCGATDLSVFTGLTRRESLAKEGGANGLRIACGAGPLGNRRHHSLVKPIDWKLVAYRIFFVIG